eukprot:SAG31_NODE_26952_length_433_cov_1.700599_1_plen_55_part_01
MRESRRARARRARSSSDQGQGCAGTRVGPERGQLQAAGARAARAPPTKLYHGSAA